jgi:23S rRNA (pseudouridine1915-N3)-methyltransferase
VVGAGAHPRAAGDRRTPRRQLSGLRLIVVGRARGPLAAAAEEYERRIARYARLDVVEVRDEPLQHRSPAEVLAREAERITERIGDDRLIAFDREGISIDSERFAELLREGLETPPGRLSFVIGGAVGLAPTLMERASLRLSLGSFTLPHQLARVVAGEQIYRAFTIIRGEPYHR